MPLKILQVNVDRRGAAHNLLTKTIEDEKIGIALVQKPNIKMTSKNPRWLTDNTNSCAVFKTRLQLLLDHVADLKTEVIVAGDFNAKSSSWNSPSTDARGTYMDEALQVLDMVVLNEGNTPTFSRGASKSYIDITFATQKASRMIQSWRVCLEESLSLHRYIYYSINTGKQKPKRQWLERPRPQADAFRDAFGIAAGGVKDYKGLVRVIKGSQDISMATRRGDIERSQPVWWNGKIDQLRAVCNRSRRSLTRARGRDSSQNIIDGLEARYKKNRKDLRDAIRRAQRHKWAELCEELEENPWGNGYQIVTGSMRHLRTPYELYHTTKVEKIRELFPADDSPIPIVPRPASSHRFSD
ncbi:uncharacterized protein [Leptinotarsa decemlineata]|uniref:uncharacterized protein n=1 Tax=Leptinotarsa decemlineata TaxID=7539 RepID=UPI003D3060C1